MGVIGNKLDLSGKTFGRWSVLYEFGKTQHGKITWLCACSCGTEREVIGSNLTNGISKSCGCLNLELVTKLKTRHGQSHSKLYKIWTNMKSRCTNPNNQRYEDYGRRGITVNPTWLDSFECFIRDMGYPAEGFTLDRVDNDKGYYKENCRWATAIQQANNTRKNVPMIDKVFGRLTVTELVERNKLNKKVYLCSCSCGNTAEVVMDSLRSGLTKSCGCLAREVSRENMLKWHKGKVK